MAAAGDFLAGLGLPKSDRSELPVSAKRLGTDVELDEFDMQAKGSVILPASNPALATA
jgi:hypothetical protein